MLNCMKHGTRMCFGPWPKNFFSLFLLCSNFFTSFLWRAHTHTRTHTREKEKVLLFSPSSCWRRQRSRRRRGGSSLLPHFACLMVAVVTVEREGGELKQACIFYTFFCSKPLSLSVRYVCRAAPVFPEIFFCRAPAMFDCEVKGGGLSP